MNWIHSKLAIKVGPEPRGPVGEGSVSLPDTAPLGDDVLWLTVGRPSYSDTALTVLISSKTRRHLAVISSPSHIWATRWTGQGFSWNGGFPVDTVELRDLIEAPASVATGYMEETRGLTVLTDRFDVGRLTFDALDGANLFLEGEEETNFLLRQGGIAT